MNIYTSQRWKYRAAQWRLTAYQVQCSCYCLGFTAAFTGTFDASRKRATASRASRSCGCNGASASCQRLKNRWYDVMACSRSPNCSYKRARDRKDRTYTGHVVSANPWLPNLFGSMVSYICVARRTSPRAATTCARNEAEPVQSDGRFSPRASETKISRGGAEARRTARNCSCRTNVQSMREKNG